MKELREWTVTMTATARAKLIVYAETREEAQAIVEADGFSIHDIEDIEQDYVIEEIEEGFG